MPSGYFDTSTVAAPFSKRSTRALVSASSSSAARATSALPHSNATTVITFGFLMMCGVLLESIDSLECECVPVQIQRVAVRVDEAVEVAHEEGVSAFDDQRVGDVIVEAQVVLVDVAPLLMLFTDADDRFDVVDHRPFEVQAGQLVRGLGP